jgi:hypothetical protein
MSTDERDVLEVLRMELDFLEAGGYGLRPRTPRKTTSVFQDSLSCVNFGYPYRAHPCHECLLDDFVPEDQRGETVPCHHIPLNEKGETVEDLELRDNQSLTEKTVKDWLRARIKEIEAERAAQGTQVTTREHPAEA